MNAITKRLVEDLLTFLGNLKTIMEFQNKYFNEGKPGQYRDTESTG